VRVSGPLSIHIRRLPQFASYLWPPGVVSSPPVSFGLLFLAFENIVFILDKKIQDALKNLLYKHSPAQHHKKSVRNNHERPQTNRFVDGDDFFKAVACAIENAKEEIYITGNFSTD
jgi:hypothetical protein